MPWFKVDDGFHSHPKVLAASPAAIGLWTLAGSWASFHLTNGRIPDDALDRILPGSRPLAEELVSVRLWKHTRSGYQFIGWTERNPTKKEVLDTRKKRAESGRKGGLASGRTRSKNEANASPIVEPPTRPDPTRPTTPENASRSHRTRGTRLPPDFDITDEMFAWAHEHLPGFNVTAQTENFRDYWNAKTGSGATKLDWIATWRNWMRRAAAEQSSPRGRHSRQAETDQLFDAALAQARRLDSQETNHDPRGNGVANAIRQSALPPASD